MSQKRKIQRNIALEMTKALAPRQHAALRRHDRIELGKKLAAIHSTTATDPVGEAECDPW